MISLFACLLVLLVPAGVFADGSPAEMGITKRQFDQICRLVEKNASGRSGRRGASKKKARFPCKVEPLAGPDGCTIVHFLGSRATIGAGIHKVVKKAFFYGPQPRVVAECIADETAAKEIRMIEQLQGCRGIVQYFGSVAHTDRTYTIYLKYYKMGALVDAPSKGRHFSARQKLAIASDALAGLCAMHERGLVHRDLHAGNILIDKSSSGACSAALVDFDKTARPEEVSANSPPQAPRRRNPPEVLIQDFFAIDRYAADVYAMGCNLYFLEWGREVPWARSYNAHRLGSMSLERRAGLYRRIARQYAKLKREKIGSILSKAQGLTPDERLRVLIFEMLSVSPSARPKAHEAFTFLALCSAAEGTDPNSSSPPRSAQGMLL